MTTPVTRRRENTRARLLDAAARLFAEVGIDGASVEAICERAGFTRGAFYSNYESKDELFLDLASALAERRLVAAQAQVDELVASGSLTDLAEILPLIEQVMHETSDDRLSVMLWIEVRLRALRDRAFAAAYLAQEQAMFASIEAIVGGLVASGALRLRVDVTVASRMLMAAWENGMTRAALEGRDDAELSRVASAALGELVPLLIMPA